MRISQTQKVVMGSSDFHDTEYKENIVDKSENLKADSLGSQTLKSVMEKDPKTMDDGDLLADAMNQSISSFNPDLMFEQLVKDYKTAEQIYGKKLLRQISGYDEDALARNMRIPEFRRELKKTLKDRIENLKKKKLLDKKNSLTKKAEELASLVMYVEELDRLVPKGPGEKQSRKRAIYGEKTEVRAYRRTDKYKDIDIRRSVKTAIRRSRKNLQEQDLKVHDRCAKGRIYVVYGLDASGSMRGDKIASCKRAGIALAYRAIEEKDKVGLIVFGKDIEKSISPTNDFSFLLNEISTIRAQKETDIAKSLREAISLFPDTDVTRHIVLITDAMPTAGEDPEKDTLEAATEAKRNNITISLVGIRLDKKGRKLAEKIVEIGSGKLYLANDADGLDQLVLEDYSSIRY